MVRAPMIAITGRRLGEDRIAGWTKDAYASPQAYSDAVAAAGGVPLVAPPVDADVAAMARSCHGLLVTGGADVDPDLYGQEPHPAAYGIDRDVDEFEWSLAVEFLQAGRPVLAVCRGMQLLNVAFGGTLDQHITGRDGLERHGDPHHGGGVLHSVSCAAGSLVAKAMGAERALVHSHHHQAVDVLAADFVATAWSGDGLVEAFELDASGAWCVAVQWHPEMTFAEDPTQLALFRAFVEASGLIPSESRGSAGR